jgi:hypothetical protein
MAEKKERTLWEKFFNYDKMLSRKLWGALAASILAIFVLVYVGLLEYKLSYFWVILGFVAAFVVYVVGAIKAEYNWRHGVTSP